MVSPDIEKAILEALADQKYKWRTTRGVAQQLGVDEKDILKAIQDNEEAIVQSSTPSSDGSPLYTTRAKFHQSGSSFEKIVAAFKGRAR
ncbi:MAG: hypothetical protein HYV17_14880 [Xanthomonadales bacterium]|nr:hypothetical protein [Xanthomonadales bacterium]